MILETERLYLRKMTQEDYPALCRMLQDPEVMYAYEHAFSDTEAHEWLDKQLARYAEYGFGLWAVILKETGEMIGQCWRSAIFSAKRTGIKAMPQKRPQRAKTMPLTRCTRRKCIPSSGIQTKLLKE